ncbi:MAG: DUF2147 domain-containing protein [Aquitalea sp.]|nr:DUF2147 domain-containing protein [Aquitalea sp.]
MRNMLKGGVLAIGMAVLSHAVWADSPTGSWKAVDDDGKQVKAVVQIAEGVNGELSGKIIKLFHNPEAICEKCDGERKGKPVNGMTILWGLKKDGDNWENGKIIDPESGKIYSARMKLVDGGKKLEVRGFLGVSLLGRTQVWERQ